MVSLSKERLIHVELWWSPWGNWIDYLETSATCWGKGGTDDRKPREGETVRMYVVEKWSKREKKTEGRPLCICISSRFSPTFLSVSYVDPR